MGALLELELDFLLSQLCEVKNLFAPSGRQTRLQLQNSIAVLSLLYNFPRAIIPDDL